MKQTKARTSSQHARINYNKLGKIAYHVKNLPEIFYSKSRSRLSHAIVLHNCKQGQQWINYNYIYKTSLLNISKRSIDLSVATWIHSNKITAVTDLEKTTKSLKSETLRSLVCMLVLVTTQITKIHGIHLCKDGMAYIKTHVELLLIRCTHQQQQK